VTTDDRSDKPEDDDDGALDGAVADAFARRGEMIPTTVEEVRAAEDDDVEASVELPASLRAWGASSGPESVDGEEDVRTRSPKPPRSEANVGAASQRVVSIDELRRARAEKRGLRLSHAVTFGMGLAVAAGAALFLRTPPADGPRAEPGSGTAGPLGSSSSEVMDDRVEIPAVRACTSDCCGGSECAAAQGEQRVCASGRTCVGCGESSGKGVYRVRIANLVPTKLLDGVPLDALDVCARPLGGEWACVPAFAEPTATPAQRTLSKLVSTVDLANGLEVEVRPRGTKQVLGHWRDSVRMGPTVLCRGFGALISNEKDEHLGSLLFLLEDTHWVELGRAADVATLKASRAKLAFADVSPSILETAETGAGRFALALGPFDQPTAEKLRWALLEKGQSAKIDLGESYVGAPLTLP